MTESYCIYLRKSRTDEEAELRGEGETLARHEKALVEYARKRDFSIGKIYREVVSGETISARPEMQKLLSDVSAGMWRGVLVMEVERLARGDTVDQGIVAQTFKYSDTLIVTPIKTYDPNNEFDEEYFEFGLFMARREYTAIKRRLVRGRVASAKEGKFLGSIAPYGYKKVKLENDKGYTLEIIPNEAGIVRQIFDWYTQGMTVDGERRRLGYKMIARRLNELKIPPPKSDYWFTDTVKSIVSNPVYAGKIRYGYRSVKKTVTPKGKKVSRPRDEESDRCIIADGLHEAIISDELFELAQSISKSTPCIPDRTQPKNPLAGLIRCGKCGYNMQVGGSPSKADYLFCRLSECKNVSSPLRLVERRVLDILKEWADDYSVEAKNDKPEPDSGILDSAIAQTGTEISALKAQLEKAYELVERGIYSPEEFAERSGSIKRQIEEAEKALEGLKAESYLEEERRKVRKQFVPAISKLLDIYDELSISEKNSMLKLIIDHIDYEKDKKGDPNGFVITMYPKLPKK